MVFETSISVIIPVLNGAQTISDTLSALINQSNKPKDLEIIVVDNGSVDGTQEIVRKYNVTLLTEPKRGPSAARNCGLRNASGEIIGYLDADTIPTRRWLREIIKPFSNPDVFIVSGKLLFYSLETPAQRFVARRGGMAEEAANHDVFPFAPSGNMAVRRVAALAIGGWDEDMRTSEDVDFSYRLLRKYPSRIIYSPDALVMIHTRRTDQELKAQAWSWGEGLGHLYRKYPEATRYTFGQVINLILILGFRISLPLVLKIGYWLGLCTSEELEFAVYNRIWSWYYWRGFFSMYRSGRRRENP
jgi:glycosyltransferase involved in cell wall biosynthesis